MDRKRLLVSGLLVLILVAALAAELLDSNQDLFSEVWRFLRVFVTSPGFGGLGALVAGILVWVQTSRRLNADRAFQRSESWWRALEVVTQLKDEERFVLSAPLEALRAHPDISREQVHVVNAYLTRTRTASEAEAARLQASILEFSGRRSLISKNMQYLTVGLIGQIENARRVIDDAQGLEHLEQARRTIDNLEELRHQMFDLMDPSGF